jgi:predicted acylesterase/phospholipase RssA
MSSDQPAGAPAESVRRFEDVHRDERARLGLNPDLVALDGTGLAFSGGGIRSASFALGVLQVLLNEGAFRRFDYLSTVSGGGYLGAAISWWLHRAALDPLAQVAPGARGNSSEGRSRYEAFRRQFGSKVQGARTLAGPRQASEWTTSNWLAYVRQHGNYLQPKGVGYASLAASALRVCLYPLFVYGIALVGLFALVRAPAEALRVPLVVLTGLATAAVACVTLVTMSWVYGPATWFASFLGSGASAFLYRQRTRFRANSGWLLSAIIVGLLLASIPALHDLLEARGGRWIASLSSLGLGTLGTAYQFVMGRARERTPGWIGPLRLVVTAALVIYGLLLGSYSIAGVFDDPVRWGAGALAFAAAFGFFVNTNYAGLARLYRDRLMETFLPDTRTVARNEWDLATLADRQTVSGLGGRLSPTGELAPVTSGDCPRPLHLINCNAVLMDSPKDVYRNRGGDSFVISACWSGSDATGWIPTRRLGDGAMSLPTAMSISGAAANPNAAPNGLGITRNRWVSFLMSLFNVRLGYWMWNPARAAAKPSNRPNLWVPGFRQGLLGRGLSEESRFVELTDGGHFDNTALYELIRRRTRLIIVAEAGCDPEFAMEDLANAIEKVRVDFSVFIEFKDPTYSLEALRPRRRREFATQGFAIGRIRYPKGGVTSPEYEDGVLVYLQAVPTASMPADIVSYWRRHGDFPNDTTADQFFTEENLEAYRELGYAIAGELHRYARSGEGALADVLGRFD